MRAFHFQTFWFDDMFGVIDGIAKEAAIINLQVHYRFSKRRKYFIYMMYVFLHILGVDNDFNGINHILYGLCQ